MIVHNMPSHEYVIIVASGASAKGFVPPDNIPVIAVNGVIEWIERADYFFTLDPSTENIKRMRNRREGTRYFAAVPSNYYNLPSHVDKMLRIVGRGFGNVQAQKGLCKEPHNIHTGNSAWGALGLAYHMGAKRVLIIGVDGDNSPRCEGGYSRDLSHLSELFLTALNDIKIVNCGNLTRFEKTDLNKAVEWLKTGVMKKMTHRVQTIACVYKTGGEYTLDYVKRLAASVAMYDVEFVCLSDDPQVAKYATHIPLQHPEWTGWWCKLELFEQLKGHVLYFDLDTMIVGDITPLLNYDHTFTMLSDFYKPQFPASGVMAWQGDYSYISAGFTIDQDKDYRQTGNWGDQGWITRRLNQMSSQIDRFDALFPHLIGSYKCGYRLAQVVCFHGKPRPHEINWKIENWNT